MTLILDDDKHVVLNEGDVVVQRATIHGWKNEGTDWARMFFVMLRKSLLSIDRNPILIFVQLHKSLRSETRSLKRNSDNKIRIDCDKNCTIVTVHLTRKRRIHISVCEPDRVERCAYLK